MARSSSSCLPLQDPNPPIHNHVLGMERAHQRSVIVHYFHNQVRDFVGVRQFDGVARVGLWRYFLMILDDLSAKKKM